jgi:hypothetical protein
VSNGFERLKEENRFLRDLLWTLTSVLQEVVDKIPEEDPSVLRARKVVTTILAQLEARRE